MNNTNPTENYWGVQLDDSGSMDFWDTEQEARQNARGCPVWKVTYELLEAGASDVPR